MFGILEYIFELRFFLEKEYDLFFLLFQFLRILF